MAVVFFDVVRWVGQSCNLETPLKSMYLAINVQSQISNMKMMSPLS